MIICSLVQILIVDITNNYDRSNYGSEKSRSESGRERNGSLKQYLAFKLFVISLQKENVIQCAVQTTRFL